MAFVIPYAFLSCYVPWKRKKEYEMIRNLLLTRNTLTTIFRLRSSTLDELGQMYGALDCSIRRKNESGVKVYWSNKRCAIVTTCNLECVDITNWSPISRPGTLQEHLDHGSVFCVVEAYPCVGAHGDQLKDFNNSIPEEYKIILDEILQPLARCREQLHQQLMCGSLDQVACATHAFINNWLYTKNTQFVTSFRTVQIKGADDPMRMARMKIFARQLSEAFEGAETSEDIAQITSVSEEPMIQTEEKVVCGENPAISQDRKFNEESIASQREEGKSLQSSDVVSSDCDTLSADSMDETSDLLTLKNIVDECLDDDSEAHNRFLASTPVNPITFSIDSVDDESSETSEDTSDYRTVASSDSRSELYMSACSSFVSTDTLYGSAHSTPRNSPDASCLDLTDVTKSDNMSTTDNSSATLIEAAELLSSLPEANIKSKPPNVLVYCGKKDSTRIFEQTKSVLAQLLDRERYTVYQLRYDDVCSSPWTDNTAVLVIRDAKLPDEVEELFYQFFCSGGYVLSFGSSFDLRLMNRIGKDTTPRVRNLRISGMDPIPLIHKPMHYTLEAVQTEGGERAHDVAVVATDADSGDPVIVRVTDKHTSAIALLSAACPHKEASEVSVTPEMYETLQKHDVRRKDVFRRLLTLLGLHCLSCDVPQLTPIVLVARTELVKERLLNGVEPRLASGVMTGKATCLRFTTKSDDKSATANMFPVKTNSNPDTFNSEEYFSNLNTQMMGNLVLHCEIISSTMDVIDTLMLAIPNSVGVVCICDRQTRGKGRGGNAWLSPAGCAMCSIHLVLPLDSPLGQAASLIQIFTGLAIVEAVRSQAGYELFDLRLKWPNDLYYKNEFKLGGILGNCTVMGNKLHANIGFGVNLSNSAPTTCVNDLIAKLNEDRTKNGLSELLPFSREQLLGRTLSCLEMFINQYQSGNQQQLLDLYYERWIHSGSRVYVQEREQYATVTGVDSYGYLQVMLESNNELISLAPDGNSFDMMRNHIVMKSNT